MELNHVRCGGGEPLVLLHGIGHRWQAWQPVLDLLAEHHDVIAVDLPGFGETPWTSGTVPGTAGIVAALAAFFDGAGLGAPHVAGNSLGGAVALELAAAGLVRSATALSPAGFFATVGRLRAGAVLCALRAGTFLPAPLIRRAMRVDPIRVACFAPLVCRPRRLDPEHAAADALALRRGRGFRPTLWAGRRYRFTGAPSLPVTIGWGTRDRVLPPSQARVARERLPRARHVALEGCGHVPMSDDPHAVARLILETTGGTPGQPPLDGGHGASASVRD